MDKQFNPKFLIDEAAVTGQLRLLNLDQTKSKVGMGKTLIYRLIASGEFPEPVPLTKSRSRVAWIESEVDEYILQCAANRIGKAA